MNLTDSNDSVAAESDNHLVRAAQRGDRQSFAELVERYYPVVFACAWRRTRNRADAEDVAQDVMAKFGSSVLTLREPQALRGFLLKLTVNAVVDLMRHRRREERGIASYETDPSRAGEMDSEAEDRFRIVWDMVQRLPEQQREAVTLVYADGASHEEAAVVLGCAESTVSYHVHAARKRLKQWLREHAQ